MFNCDECKIFLDKNSIKDKASYLNWFGINGPNQFKKYGEEDFKYKEAIKNSSTMGTCFSKWYSDNPTCFRDTECLICLEKFKNTDDVVNVCQNNHRFHRSCIDKWIKGDNDTCPTCRSPIIPILPSRSTPSRPTSFVRSKSPSIPRPTLSSPPRSTSFIRPTPSSPPRSTSFVRSRLPGPTFNTKKSCKIGYVRNRSTKRCRKSCAVGQRRSRTTGRCLKGRKSKKRSKGRKSKKTSRFVKNSPLGLCRGRKKSVCKNDPNCTYRKRVGCVKKRGAIKTPFQGPMMHDSGY